MWITYYFLFSPSKKKYLELACFIPWPLIVILNVEVVILFMEPSQQFALCDLRSTSVRPGIYEPGPPGSGLTDFLFLLRASDLVMKVDALLSAAPKGEVRRDVHFIKDSHRWAAILPATLLFLKGFPQMRIHSWPNHYLYYDVHSVRPQYAFWAALPSMKSFAHNRKELVTNCWYMFTSRAHVVDSSLASLNS